MPREFTIIGPPPPLIVGEQPGRGCSWRHPMYPYPPNSAGGRMPRLLGLSCKDYIRTFHRVNLIRDSEDEQSWDGRLARAAAEALVTSRPGGLILALGSRVRNAFCSAARVRAGNQPEFFHGERRRVSANCDPTWILFLPHPSGRNRMWNDRDNIAKLRSTINHWAPGLVPLEVT